MWERLRTDRDEILDREGASERGLRILADLEHWNRVAGWTRAHLRAVEDHWVALGEPRPFRVIDVGCGLGGLLRDIAGWADGRGVPVRLYGVDSNADYVAAARAQVGDLAEVFEGDATALLAKPRAFHLATCALMLHHLPFPERARLVAELDRVAQSAYLFDLTFTLHGVLGATVVPRLAGMGRDAASDGLTSVRRSLTPAEFRTLVEPLPVRAVRVFPSAMATLPERKVRVRSRRHAVRAIRMRLPEASVGLPDAVPPRVGAADV